MDLFLTNVAVKSCI